MLKTKKIASNKKKASLSKKQIERLANKIHNFIYSPNPSQLTEIETENEICQQIYKIPTAIQEREAVIQYLTDFLSYTLSVDYKDINLNILAALLSHCATPLAIVQLNNKVILENGLHAGFKALKNKEASYLHCKTSILAILSRYDIDVEDALIGAINDNIEHDILAQIATHPSFDPNFEITVSGAPLSALLLACRHGNIQAAALLLSQPKLDINRQSLPGRVSLMHLFWTMTNLFSTDSDNNARRFEDYANIAYLLIYHQRIDLRISVKTIMENNQATYNGLSYFIDFFSLLTTKIKTESPSQFSEKFGNLLSILMQFFKLFVSKLFAQQSPAIIFDWNNVNENHLDVLSQLINKIFKTGKAVLIDENGNNTYTVITTHISEDFFDSTILTLLIPSIKNIQNECNNFNEKLKNIDIEKATLKQKIIIIDNSIAALSKRVKDWSLQSKKPNTKNNLSLFADIQREIKAIKDILSSVNTCFATNDSSLASFEKRLISCKSADELFELSLVFCHIKYGIANFLENMAEFNACYECLVEKTTSFLNANMQSFHDRKIQIPNELRCYIKQENQRFLRKENPQPSHHVRTKTTKPSVYQPIANVPVLINIETKNEAAEQSCFESTPLLSSPRLFSPPFSELQSILEELWTQYPTTSFEQLYLIKKSYQFEKKEFHEKFNKHDFIQYWHSVFRLAAVGSTNNESLSMKQTSCSSP